MSTFERDLLIRTALAPDPAIEAPAGLGDDIHRAVSATAQHRPRFALAWLGRPWQASPVSLLLLLMMLLLLLLGSFVVVSRPPTFADRLTAYHGGPERSGVMPGPGPEGEPVIEWEAQRSGALRTVMPIVVDGRIFVVDDGGTVGALDEGSGQVLWEVALGSSIRASPVWADGNLVVGSDSGVVVALSELDGSEVWRFVASGPVSAPLAVMDQRIFVGSEGAYLYELEAASGRVQWSLPVGGPITRGAAISDGVLYVGAEGGRLSAIDLADRETTWSVELGAGHVGTPAVVGGIVYVSRGIDALTASPHDLVAVRASDGSLLWSFGSPAGRQVHLGAVAGGLVYAVAEDDTVYALSRDTGVVDWSHATDGPITSLAALVGDTLFVSSSDGTVRALDALSGNLRWSLAVQGEPTMPAVVNGRVVVGTTLGRIVAIGGAR